MKAVLVVASAIALAVACSVSHKSQEYSCTSTADCASHQGTVCDNGLCVVPGTIDAPGMKGDAPRGDAPGSNGCPQGCTSCNTAQKTCTIDCSQTGMVNCNNSVTCPAGYHCDIQCKLDNQCRNGVSCIGGASCTVECSGTGTCRNVECGAGPCDVTCSGSNSCRGVNCNNSCACDVLCTGNSSCGSAITCTSLQCVQGLGCSSVLAGCHSC